MRFSIFLLGLSVSLLMLSGCNRKNITDAEFDKLQMLMTYSQVEQIIGAAPDDTSEKALMPGINVKMCTWRNSDGTSLTIVFENNVARHFNQLDPSKLIIESGQ